MKYHIVLSQDARADIGSAFSWYERIDPSVAFRFISEGNTTMDRIAQFPFRFPVFSGAVRRARFKRFPYAIYYSVDHEEVLVKAILHQRRSDDIWWQRSYRQ
jgi:plasmid stabilization system protein ParE